MANDRQVAFRLPSFLVDQIDEKAETWSARVPGIRVTRADVVRALLVQGLEVDGAPASRPAPTVSGEGRVGSGLSVVRMSMDED